MRSPYSSQFMPVDFSKIRNVDSLEKFLASPKGFFDKISKNFDFFILERRTSKKDGSTRIVYEAIGILDRAHKVFQANTIDLLPNHDAAYGHIKKRSTKENAKLHAGKRTIVKVDIRDFFNSIKDFQITEALIDIGFNRNVAEILTPIFCTNKSLEAGFSPSSMLANAVCFGLDTKLQKWAIKNNLVYSRYSDDMAFSSDRRLDFPIGEIEKIINDFGFQLSTHKTKFMFRGEPQYVTGLSVTEKGEAHIPSSFKNNLRKDLYYIKKYGIEDHISRKYKYGKPTPEKEIDRLFGNIGYVYGIEPEFIEKLRSKNLLPQNKNKNCFIAHCFFKVKSPPLPKTLKLPPN